VAEMEKLDVAPKSSTEIIKKGLERRSEGTKMKKFASDDSD
jgi:hypothetical protein